jgi:tetratricopeptide (TPR) repeat protein
LFVCSGLAESVWGLLQLYGYLPSRHALFRITGSFLNPGPYAGYLAVVFPLALYDYLFRGGLRRWTGAATCLLILPLLPAAMSRASWLAALSGGAIVLYGRYACVLRAWAKSHVRWLRTMIAVSVLLLLLVPAALYRLKPASADGRLLVWKLELQTLFAHPLGVGLGNFSGAYGRTQAAYFAEGGGTERERFVAGNPEYAFNEFLQVGIESGILGLILLLALLALCVRTMWRTHAWNLLGALSSLLVFACFSYPFSLWPFLVFFVFLIAAAPDTNDGLTPAFAGLRANLLSLKQSFPSVFVPVSLSVLCLIAVMGIKSYLWDEREQTPWLFEQAQRLSRSGRYEQSNALLERATYISCDPMLYNVMGRNRQAMHDYPAAERCFRYAADLVPNRLYPHYLLAKLYQATDRPELMRASAERLLAQTPKVPSRAVEEMRAEMQELLQEDAYDKEDMIREAME